MGRLGRFELDSKGIRQYLASRQAGAPCYGAAKAVSGTMQRRLAKRRGLAKRGKRFRVNTAYSLGVFPTVTRYGQVDRCGWKVEFEPAEKSRRLGTKRAMRKAAIGAIKTQKARQRKRSKTR